MQADEQNGIVNQPSTHSVAETVARIEAILTQKSVTLFARIDHGGEAKKAGFEMPPTMLLIFGNPKAGTPLMLASPGSAIDLPLKLLVREDGQGKVWISFNSPEYLLNRHQLPDTLLPNIGVVAAIAEAAGR